MALVKEGISYYKEIRSDIKKALPDWPIGLADTRSTFLCGALKTEDKAYLAVFRRDKDEEDDRTMVRIPLAHLFEGEKKLSVKLAYPQEAMKENVEYTYEADRKVLAVDFKKKVMARIFEVTAE